MTEEEGGMTSGPNNHAMTCSFHVPWSASSTSESEGEEVHAEV